MTLSRRFNLLSLSSLVLAAAAVLSASQAQAQSSYRLTGASSYGTVRMLPGAVRIPAGVARAGSAYAAPNPPMNAAGYQYGAVKYAPSAIRTPFGVMSGSCRRIGAGIIC